MNMQCNTGIDCQECVGGCDANLEHDFAMHYSFEEMHIQDAMYDLIMDEKNTMEDRIAALEWINEIDLKDEVVTALSIENVVDDMHIQALIDIDNELLRNAI